jgi:hypothetical protein
MDLARLVFIDESGAKTNMTRLYGRAMAGRRAVDDAPSGHWHTTTMIASVRLNGSAACMVVDGATTKDIFEAYVEQILLPTLNAGDIVVLDNLSAHKSQKAHDLIESVGAELYYLPAYLPDLNPIEKMWSKEFLEAGKNGLTRSIIRDATSDEVRRLKDENGDLKKAVAELALDVRVLG